MKDLLRQEKGVSLISLAAAIIILGIITTVLVYSAKDTKHVEALTNMYTDIENLSDKISSYYSTYGKIPALPKSNYNLEEQGLLDNLKSDIGENDTGDFLIIDLSALENLTLNYGKGYENEDKLSDKDIYIINENSHNIFYLKGVTIDGKTYYTNQDKDTVKVELRYVDGIKIPDGYYYKGKDENGKITISDKKDDTGIKYIWVRLETKINSVPSGITIDEGKKEEFLESANAYEGYFQNGNDVIYVVLDENQDSSWSPKYEQEGIYKDENGDTAYIPAGFKVSKLPTMNKVNKGLVIQDETRNQYVWIEVPKSVTADAVTYTQIEDALKEYVKDYQEEGYKDVWHDGCGIKSDENGSGQDKYNDMKNKMLQSIKENGGFWISRYEIGNSEATENKTSTSDGTQGTPVSKKDQVPNTYVSCSQAQEKASRMSVEGRTSSLLFGIQWDLVCKFIEENGTNPATTGSTMKDAIKTNSADWGNYADSEFIITSDNAMKLIEDTNKWSLIEKGETKDSGSSILLTTGASNRNSILNIYDFAGNDNEWTLERNMKLVEKPVVARGGNYGTTNWSVARRIGHLEINSRSFRYAFRTTIY